MWGLWVGGWVRNFTNFFPLNPLSTKNIIFFISFFFVRNVLATRLRNRTPCSQGKEGVREDGKEGREGGREEGNKGRREGDGERREVPVKCPLGAR